MNILLIFSGFIVAFVVVLYCERKIRNLSVKLKNNVHFYVARDKNGELFLYMGKPVRGRYAYRSKSDGAIHLNWLNINEYGLNESDYANLKWEDSLLRYL